MYFAMGYLFYRRRPIGKGSEKAMSHIFGILIFNIRCTVLYCTSILEDKIMKMWP